MISGLDRYLHVFQLQNRLMSTFYMCATYFYIMIIYIVQFVGLFFYINICINIVLSILMRVVTNYDRYKLWTLTLSKSVGCLLMGIINWSNFIQWYLQILEYRFLVLLVIEYGIRYCWILWYAVVYIVLWEFDKLELTKSYPLVLKFYFSNVDPLLVELRLAYLCK